MLLDVAAAVETAMARGKVGVVGYCLGGTPTWLDAGKRTFAAAHPDTPVFTYRPAAVRSIATATRSTTRRAQRWRASGHWRSFLSAWREHRRGARGKRHALFSSVKFQPKI
jgi:hypothetical protein